MSPSSTVRPGDAVEVFSDDGSATWRPARLAHPFASRPLFLVAFDGDDVVKEIVAADRVRPRLDPEESARFELYQMVEGFAGGVWRPGVVFKAEVEGRWGVFFLREREEVELGALEVRARRDWVDGKWVDAEVKGITETLYSSGRQVEVSRVSKGFPVAWYAAQVMKAVDEKNFLVEYESLRTEGDTLIREIVASQYIRPLPPPTLESKSFNLLDEVEAFYKCGWWRGVITEINTDSKYHVRFMYMEEIELSHSELRLPYEWIDEQWVQASQDKSANIQLLHASNSSHECKIPDSTIHACSYVDEALCTLPTSATCSENGDLDRLTYQNKTECDRPCKKAKKGETTETNGQFPDSRCTEDPFAAKTGFDVPTPIMDEEPNFRIKDLGEKCSSSPFNGGFLINQKGVWKHAGEKKRKNSRPQRLRIIEPPSEGDSMGHEQDNEVVGEPPTEGLSVTQQETAATCGIFCDNGLSNAMVGPSEANLVDTSASCVQISESGSETRNEALVSTVGKQFMKRSHVEKAGDASVLQPSPLPFVKSSPMWDSLEAMEVFSVFPQQPHFRQLEQYNKDFREGMAIGLMVTFSKLVNKINKLRVIDSRNKFDEILKSLVHLEGNGFEVQRIRARLVQLLRMKEKQDILADKRAALEALLMKKKREKVELNVGMRSTEKSARVLEQSLSLMYEERDHLLEQIRNNDSILDKLKADSRAAEDALLSARSDFEATISAVW